MQIKNFEGNSLTKILKEIKKDFGKEAVILSTEEKNIYGSEAKYYEVRAAVPEPAKDHERYGASSKGAAVRPLTEVGGEDLRRWTERLESIARDSGKERTLNRLESSIKDLKVILLESLQIHQSRPELKQLSKELLQLHQHLVLTNLDPVYIQKMMESISSFSAPDSLPAGIKSKEEYYKSLAIKWMISKIAIAPPLRVAKGQQSVHVFIGPSGGGKTTSIAKLASICKKNKDLKSLLISYDQEKIGASETLRVFAKILDMPMVMMNHAEDLKHKISMFPDRDLILIDTAGRSPRSEDELQDLLALKEIGIPLDFHLVMSLTEKERHLDHALRQFSTLGLQSLIFSKLDESWTYGEMFNLSCRYSLPLGFFSTGCRVPDDWEDASKERVIERILGL